MGTRRTTPEQDQQHIEAWFLEKGVHILPRITGNEVDDEQWLQRLGIIGSNDKLIGTRTVTDKFLSDRKDFGGGWLRGGAESFYKIVEITYGSGGNQYIKKIAFKAINTLGDIKEKTLTEAAWMAVASEHGLCGSVYAAGNGTIVKEFLISDPQEMKISAEEYEAQVNNIKSVLSGLGLRLAAQRRIETVQCKGKLFVIDLGSGDIDGKGLATFMSEH